MNNQQIFDKVCERLRDGAGRAVDSNRDCLYLHPVSGVKCAVGIFIKEGHKAQKFKGDIYGLLDKYTAKEIFGFELENKESEYLLNKLQYIHDNEYNWDNDEFNNEHTLEHASKKFNLTYTPPA